MRTLCAALVAVLVVAPGCNFIDSRPRPDGPSVLLVTVDTLRADRVGAYGAELAATPVMDRLAAEGVRFEKAIAPTPLTLPSHATLLTGLYPPRHGIRHNGVFRLDGEHVTLAERFSDAGYATGAVVGAVVLKASFGLDQGFDFYDDAFGQKRASTTGYPERSAGEVTDVALAWLAGTPGPFFLWVHYYDPHASYTPPAPFDEAFAGRPYEGEVAYVDAELGRLLAGLGEQAQNTLVALTSDHGESLGAHGERTHSYTLYDATLSVPLILRGPGIPAGGSVGGVVSIAAVAPTLLALAGLPGLPEPDGKDLSAHLAGADPPEGAAYAESLATQLDHGWAPLHALRTATRHYIRAPRPELYDVRADPGERHNLLASGAAGDEARALDDQLETFIERGAPLQTAPLDESTLGQLRALGYALPDEPVASTGIDPKDGLVSVELYVRARTAFFEGALDEAEEATRSLLASNPRSAQGHMLLAGIHRQRGDAAGAVPHAERAAALLPQSAAFQGTLGDLKLALGDLPGAVRHFRAAVAIDPALADAHVGTMWAALTGGSVEEAEEAAATAAALRPDDAAIQFRIAETWDRMGHAEGALAAYRTVLGLDPRLAEAELGAAVQLVRLGRTAEAAQSLARAGEAATDPNARNRLAIAWAGQGETERAEALFRENLAEHPDHPGTRRNLAHLLRASGRGEEASAVEGG